MPYLGNFDQLIRSGDDRVKAMNGKSFGKVVKERVYAVWCVRNLV